MAPAVSLLSVSFPIDSEKNRRHSFWRGGLLVFTVVLQGCNATPESICAAFPKLDAQISVAVTRFESLEMPKTGRRLASAPAPAPAFADRERSEWLAWTEKTLAQLDTARDVFATFPRYRPAIKQLDQSTLALVSMHGFIDQAKMMKAHQEALRLRQSLHYAYRDACDTESDDDAYEEEVSVSQGKGKSSKRRPAAQLGPVPTP